MFLIPFLKYLKPFRGRLGLAFGGMFLVSLFGALNIMMIMPFLRILLNVQERPSAGRSAAQVEQRPPKASSFIPGEIQGWITSRIEGPRKAIDAKVEEVRAWYKELAAREPLHALLLLSVLLLIATAIKCSSEYMSKYNLAYTFYFTNMRMRQDLYENVLRQDYLFFTKNAPGYLISRIDSDIRAIQQIIDKMLSSGVQEPMTLVGLVFVLFFISPHLTIVVLCILPPAGLLLYSFSRSLRKNTRKQKQKADQLTSSMAESLYNIRLVKVFGTEELEIRKFLDRNLALFKYVMKRRIAKFASGPIMEFMGTIGACGVLLLGGYMILGKGSFLAGKLTPEAFIAYLIAVSRFYRPIKSISALLMTYQEGRVSAERITQMLSLEPVVIEAADPKPFSELRDGVELRGVGFRFQDKEILRKVTLRVPKGHKVALVGQTGSGKTTIANLVARLFDPVEGSILIDGVDLREIRVADLRGRIGFVTQQTILFDDTVANNITYGAHAGPDALPAVMAAAKAANADEFIRALDGGLGYETRIGPGGTKLSGGQAQRIALARAIYRNPQLLILDEATSALDAESQALVESAINRLMTGRTSIVIAHRLSTVRNADRIYVLHQGAVVEQGTHDELMALRGRYHQLYEQEETQPPPEAEGGVPSDGQPG